MGSDNGTVYSGFKSSTNYKHIIDAVLLKYKSHGVTKRGMVKIHLGLDLDNENLEYRGIEYSDYEVREFLENDPSVLSRIQSTRAY